MNQHDPLVTLIIAVYNADLYLDKAIKSVVKQSYKNIELIVVDGGSTDGSIKIIEKYKDHISHYISERDNGIYDAWNKGIQLSSGDWIGFIGADDFLMDDAIASYVKELKNHKDLEYISSRVQLISKEGVKLEVIGSRWEWNKYKYFMNVAHVGSLHSRHLYRKFGLYNTEYKIIGDYEFLFRPGKSLKAGYINNITASMRIGGASDSNNMIDELIKIKIDYLGYSYNKAYIVCSIAKMKIRFRKFLNQYGVFIRLRK